MSLPATELTSSPIRDHVAMIHQLAEGIDGVLVVSVFHDDRPGSVTHHRVGDVAGMVDAIEAHADTLGANVYAGLQVMRRGLARGQRGGEADVVAVLGLVADMDVDTGRAGEYPAEPNYVIETSPGNQQPFWLFSRPVPPAEAKAIARGLKAATGSDHGTADIAHVWRIPGTLNHPNAVKLARGRSPEPFEVAVSQPWDGSLTDPLALLVAVGSHSAPAAAPLPALGDLPDAGAITVSTEAAALLAQNDVGDRSAHASRVVEKLAFDGHNAEEAAALFLAATGDWFARYAGRDALADFRRMWAKFYRDPMHGLEPWTPRTLPVAANDNDADWIRDEAEFKSDASLSDLTRPGGFVEELVDWIVSSAEHPSRELALSAVLPFVGALIGRRFSGYRDARSNIYGIALAPSGYGKDHARQQIKRLIASANLHCFSGPARIMSATGLRNALMEKPSMNCQIDEIAGPFREMLDPRANVHQQMLKSDLLEYFSTASTYFEGAAYAQAKAVKLEAPNLCVYGTSTGDDFWNSVSGLSLRDGFLARLLLFNVEGMKPELTTPKHDVKHVPDAIRIGAQQLAMAGRSGRLDIPQSDRGDMPRPTVDVPMTPEAEQRRAEFKADIERKLAKADSAHHAILNRAVEHAVKLALIVAVATTPEAPTVTGVNMAWAVQLSWLSCCALMRESSFNIADSQREAAVGKVLRLVRDAGEAGLTIGKLTDRTRGLDQRLRREIVQDLAVAGRIVEVTQPTGPRGGKPTMRLRLAG